MFNIDSGNIHGIGFVFRADSDREHRADNPQRDRRGTDRGTELSKCGPLAGLRPHQIPISITCPHVPGCLNINLEHNISCADLEEICQYVPAK